MLENLLHSHSGVIRKTAATALQIPRFYSRVTNRNTDKFAVLVNSFPKSGTHLLDQIVSPFPLQNYGAFIASMGSSFRFHELTKESILKELLQIVPDELVRAHLFYEPEYAKLLNEHHIIHFFIYRDPRDVVISEAYYLREMNHWHRLHNYFKQQPSLQDAIRLSITGLPRSSKVDYPSIAERYSRYLGWISDPNCISIRFEDLISQKQPEIVRHLVKHYLDECESDLPVEELFHQCLNNIDPGKSHTHRSGKTGGWREKMSPETIELFHRVANSTLLELGYETEESWNEQVRTVQADFMFR